MKELPLKRSDLALPIKTFESEDGKTTFLVMKSGEKYHCFTEVESKSAAISCGSNMERDIHTNEHWNELWENS